MRARRFFSFFLIALMLSALLMLPAAGTNSLSFIAVNDTIPMTLSGDSLPFYSGGTLYVPYTAFNASSLGFYPSYNTADKLLTLFNRNSRLVFDLAAGTVTDENKLTQSVSTVTRGGIVFLPAAFCANYFEVQVSDLSSQSGYQIIRFTTGSQIYDDGLFLEKAENLVAYRVSQYIGSTTPTVPETPSVTKPSPATPASGETDTPDLPEQEPVQIYLALTGTSDTEESLNYLAQRQLPAVFFLTADEILQNRDLVRRIAAGGYPIGLRVPVDEAPADALTRGNQALDSVLKQKTLLALLPQDTDGSAVETSYRVWRQPRVRLTATEAAAAAGETRVLFCTAENLAASVAILKETNATFLQLLETTNLP